MHPFEKSTSSPFEVMPLGWYAVYTRHQHEKSAAQLLTRRGFEVLLPLYRSENRWTDRTQVVFLPLFPNYVFVHADLERRVEVLRSAGVCWFVGSSSGPSTIAEEEIDLIRKLASCTGKIEPHPFLERGSDVRVLRGPLAGLTGVLVRAKNRHRVVVSLELLQKSAIVEVELTHLERIWPPPSPPSYAEIRNC